KGEATVWDARTGAALVELKGFKGAVFSVAFSPDGTRFFTVLYVGPAKAWDASTGKEVPGAAIPDLKRNDRLSPDGRLFARAELDRVKVVPLVPDAEEIAYRRLHMQPDVRRYRAGYLAARAARDAFAAAFYLNLIPAEERKGVLEQAEADAFVALCKLANEQEWAGKLEEAVPLYIKILKINKAKLGPEDPATLKDMETLGGVFSHMGQFEKAIPLWEEVVKYRKAELVRGDAAAPGAVPRPGWGYRDAGRLKEAIALLEEVAAKDAQRTPDLLDVYERAGEHAKVIDLSLKQLAEVRKSWPENTDWQAYWLARLGRAYLAQKKWSEAEPYLRECVANWAKSPIAGGWSAAFDAQSLLGGSLLGQKKYAEAEPLLLKGYEGMKQRERTAPWEPLDKRRLAEALDRLIDLYTATNRPDEVKKWPGPPGQEPPPPPPPPP